MLFNSAIFLFAFLPVVLAIYFLAPKRIRNAVLFIASLFFYAWGEQEVVLIMLLSTIVDFNAGLLMASGRKRLGLILSVVTNLTLLIIFKYTDFIFENFNNLVLWLGLTDQQILELPHIALPIGISFYTFQTMSYSIDVYRGNVEPNRNFVDFATYVTLFPQLIAGPIVRYVDIVGQLKDRSSGMTDFAYGVERFMLGMIKKMIFANTFATVADNIFAHQTQDLSVPAAWLGVIAYALQIYFDFSAYSDMAIGLGRMFGFHIPENFNYPYIARSIREFWRRWHISLSTWFRDYLYISLGGNRVGKARLYFNLIFVFFVTGLWHGASWNFVVWGLFHGLFLLLERIGLEKLLRSAGVAVERGYTLLVVLIGWVFFRADDLPAAIAYIQAMFGFNRGIVPFDLYFNIEVLITGIAGIVFCAPVFVQLRQFLEEGAQSFRTVKLTGYVLILGFLFIFSIALIAAGSYNPFIYFRF